MEKKYCVTIRINSKCSFVKHSTFQHYYDNIKNAYKDFNTLLRTTNNINIYLTVIKKDNFANFPLRETLISHCCYRHNTSIKNKIERYKFKVYNYNPYISSETIEKYFLKHFT